MRSDDLEEQLLDVVRRFSLDLAESMTRCSVCNAELESVRKPQVKGRVPDGVYARQEEFWRCASCGRFYWHGSHWDNVTVRLRRLGVAGAHEDGPPVDESPAPDSRVPPG